VIETQHPGTPPNPALQLMNSSLSLGLHAPSKTMTA